jgi:hypothetical protein
MRRIRVSKCDQQRCMSRSAVFSAELVLALRSAARPPADKRDCLLGLAGMLVVATVIILTLYSVFSTCCRSHNSFGFKARANIRGLLVIERNCVLARSVPYAWF